MRGRQPFEASVQRLGIGAANTRNAEVKSERKAKGIIFERTHSITFDRLYSRREMLDIGLKIKKRRIFGNFHSPQQKDILFESHQPKLFEGSTCPCEQQEKQSSTLRAPSQTALPSPNKESEIIVRDSFLQAHDRSPRTSGTIYYSCLDQSEFINGAFKT